MHAGVIGRRLVVASAIVVVAGACSSSTKTTSTSATTVAAATSTTAHASSSLLTLDTKKNYGNKYADGGLPVGDAKFVTDGAKAGSVYLCRTPNGEAGGAQARGPWFVN